MKIKYLVRTIQGDTFNYLRDEAGDIMFFDTFEEAWEVTDNGLKAFVERIDCDEYFVIQYRFTPMEERKKCEVHNMYSLLNLINKHSTAGRDYDQMNFQIGLKKYTTFRLLGTMTPYKE